MNKTIHVTSVVSDETAAVEVNAPAFREQGEGSLTATGWAKKHPNDKPDSEIGYNLAVARALRNLADQYEKCADEAMNNPLQTVTYSSSVLSPYTITFDGKYGSSDFNYNEDHLITKSYVDSNLGA